MKMLVFCFYTFFFRKKMLIALLNQQRVHSQIFAISALIISRFCSFIENYLTSGNSMNILSLLRRESLYLTSRFKHQCAIL